MSDASSNEQKPTETRGKSLARKGHWVFLGLLILTAIFAWRPEPSWTFPPPPPEVWEVLKQADILFAEGQPDKALELLKPLAEAGDPHAQYEIGRRYYFGDGIDEDIEKSAPWLRRAADASDFHAMVIYARVLAANEPQEAAEWLQIASDHGYKLATFYLWAYFDPTKGSTLTWWEKTCGEHLMLRFHIHFDWCF